MACQQHGGQTLWERMLGHLCCCLDMQKVVNFSPKSSSKPYQSSGHSTTTKDGVQDLSSNAGCDLHSVIDRKSMHTRKKKEIKMCKAEMISWLKVNYAARIWSFSSQKTPLWGFAAFVVLILVLTEGQGVGQNKANFTMNYGKLMDNFPYFLIFYTKSLVAALDKCHQESRIHMAMWSRVHIPHNFNILGWGNEMQNAQKRLKESQPAMIISCSEVILFPLQPDQHRDSNEDDYLHVRI